MNNRIALKIVSRYEADPEKAMKSYNMDQIKLAHKLTRKPFKVRSTAKLKVATKKETSKSSVSKSIRSPKWEEQTVSELRTAAKIAGMSGYSKMKKSELIGALTQMG